MSQRHFHPNPSQFNLSNKLINQIGKEEFQKKYEELKQNIKCCICYCNLEEEGLNIDQFVQCIECKEDVYCCYRDILAMKRRHKKLPHQFTEISPIQRLIGSSDINIMTKEIIQNINKQNREFGYSTAVSAINMLNIKGYGQAAPLFTMSVELCWLSYNFYRGNINDEEYRRQILLTIVNTESIAYGSHFGASIGKMIANMDVFDLSQYFSKSNKSIIAFGGAVCGAIAAAKMSTYLFELVFPNKFNENKLRRQQLIHESLSAFGFTADSIKDTVRFNVKTISKQYKILAKTQHPDKPGGSHEAFQQLNIQLGVLLALLDSTNNVHPDTIKNMILSISY